MNRQLLKKAVTGLAMALSLSFCIGIISTSTVQAQSRNYGWQRDRDDRRYDDRNSEWYRRQQIERAREIARQRAIERARQREWERNRNTYGNRRYDPYYNSGSYGGYGGYNSGEEQRGYRNGLKEGLDDAHDRDSFNPSRHSSFRDGNPAYRRGFARGYEQGYRQNAYSRRY